MGNEIYKLVKSTYGAKGFNLTDNEFAADMKDAAKREKLYGNLSKDAEGFKMSKEEFDAELGFGKEKKVEGKTISDERLAMSDEGKGTGKTAGETAGTVAQTESPKEDGASVSNNNGQMEIDDNVRELMKGYNDVARQWNDVVKANVNTGEKEGFAERKETTRNTFSKRAEFLSYFDKLYREDGTARYKGMNNANPRVAALMKDLRGREYASKDRKEYEVMDLSQISDEELDRIYKYLESEQKKAGEEAKGKTGGAAKIEERPWYMNADPVAAQMSERTAAQLQKDTQENASENAKAAWNKALMHVGQEKFRRDHKEVAENATTLRSEIKTAKRNGDSGADLAFAGQFVKDTEDILKGQSKYDAEKNSVLQSIGKHFEGFGRGVADTDNIPLYGGIQEAARYGEVARVALKANDGEGLTENEKILLRSYMGYLYAQQQIESQFGKAYSSGLAAGESAAFMAEMVMFDAAIKASGKLAAKAGAKVLPRIIASMYGDYTANRMGQKVAIKGVENAVGKFGAQVGGAAVQTALQASTYANLERDRARAALDGREFGMKEIAGSIGNSFIEVMSEQAFNGINGWALGKAYKGLDGMGLKWFGNIEDMNKFMRYSSQVLRSQPEEYIEEYEGAGLKMGLGYLLGDKEMMEDARRTFTAEGTADMFLSFMLPGMIAGGTYRGIALAKSHRFDKKRKELASALIGDDMSYGDALRQLQYTEQSGDVAEFTRRAQALHQRVMQNELGAGHTFEIALEKADQLVNDYADAMSEYNENMLYTLEEWNKMSEGERDAARISLKGVMGRILNTEISEKDRDEIAAPLFEKYGVERLTMQLGSTQEEQTAMAEYAQKLIEKEIIDSKIAEEAAVIDEKTDENGNIRVVSVDGKENTVVSDDGQTMVVRDENGEKRQVASSAVTEVSVKNAEEAKQEMAAEMRDKVGKMAEFKPGLSMTMEDGRAGVIVDQRDEGVVLRRPKTKEERQRSKDEGRRTKDSVNYVEEVVPWSEVGGNRQLLEILPGQIIGGMEVKNVTYREDGARIWFEGLDTPVTLPYLEEMLEKQGSSLGGELKANADGTAVKKSDEEVAAQRAELEKEIVGEAEALCKRLGVEVHIARDVDEIESAVAREEAKKGKRVKGWYVKSTGVVEIYLPYAESVEDVRQTIFHEVVAHKGLRDMLGDKYDSLCQSVWNGMEEEDKKWFSDYVKKSTGVEEEAQVQLMAADEYMAFMAERVAVMDEAEKSKWQKLCDTISEFLNGLFGGNARVGDAEIVGLIERSERMMEKKAEERLAISDKTISDEGLGDKLPVKDKNGAELNDAIIEMVDKARSEGIDAEIDLDGLNYDSLYVPFKNGISMEYHEGQKKSIEEGTYLYAYSVPDGDYDFDSLLEEYDNGENKGVFSDLESNTAFATKGQDIMAFKDWWDNYEKSEKEKSAKLQLDERDKDGNELPDDLKGVFEHIVDWNEAIGVDLGEIDYSMTNYEHKSIYFTCGLIAGFDDDGKMILIYNNHNKNYLSSELKGELTECLVDIFNQHRSQKLSEKGGAAYIKGDGIYEMLNFIKWSEEKLNNTTDREIYNEWYKIKHPNEAYERGKSIEKRHKKTGKEKALSSADWKKVIAKEESRPMFTGVYHDKNEKVAVATDAHKLVVSEESYEKENAGKVIEVKRGLSLEGRFPRWWALITNSEKPTAIDINKFKEAVNTFIAESKKYYSKSAALKKAIEQWEPKMCIDFGDGKIVPFRLKTIADILSLSDKLGLKTVDINTAEPGKHQVIFKGTGKNLALVMPLMMGENSEYSMVYNGNTNEVESMNFAPREAMESSIKGSGSKYRYNSASDLVLEELGEELFNKAKRGDVAFRETEWDKMDDAQRDVVAKAAEINRRRPQFRVGRGNKDESVIEFFERHKKWKEEVGDEYKALTGDELPEIPKFVRGAMTLTEYFGAYAKYQYEYDNVETAAEWNKMFERANNYTSSFIRRWFDTLRKMEVFYNAARKAGLDVTSANNAYEDSFRRQARAKYAIQQFRLQHIQPMMKSIAMVVEELKGKEWDYTWQMINDKDTKRKHKREGKKISAMELVQLYCQAMDIVEVERLNTQLEEKLPERGRAGFEKQVGATPEEIIRYVSGAVNAKSLDAMWEAIRNVSNATFDYMIEAGYANEEQKAAIIGGRQYYVPERGFAYNEHLDETSMASPFDRAEGRVSLAANPFIYLMEIADSAIQLSERNRTKQKMWNFLSDNRNWAYMQASGAAKMARVWTVRKFDENGNFIGEELRFTGPTVEEKAHDTAIRQRIKEIQAEIDELKAEKEDKSDEEIEAINKKIGVRIADIYRLDKQKIVVSMVKNELLEHEETIEKIRQGMFSDLTDEEWRDLASGTIARAQAAKSKDDALKHIVKVNVNGESYIMWFNDPGMATVLNGAKESRWIQRKDDARGEREAERHERISNRRKMKFDDLMNDVTLAPNVVTRFLSSLKTQFNWEFAYGNGLRDLQFAFLMNSIERNPVFAGKVTANGIMMMPAIARYLLNEETFGSKEWRTAIGAKQARWIEEFLSAGGETGYSFMQPVSKRRGEYNAELKKMIKKLEGCKDAKDVAKWINEVQSNKTLMQNVAHTLEFLSQLSEMSTRMGQYVTERTTGKKNIEDAALSAKEITTNFNRQGELASLFGPFYMFFNATMQGTYRALRAVSKDGKVDPKALTKMIVAKGLFMLLGFWQATYYDDDPEDETFVPDYIWKSNMKFGKIIIPTPHFFRADYYIGTCIAKWMKGEKSGEKAMFDGMKYLMEEMVPANLALLTAGFEYNDANKVTGNFGMEFDMNMVLRNITPAAMQPLMDMKLNRNYLGAPVYKVPYINNGAPLNDVHMGFGNTPDYMVQLCGMLQDVTGKMQEEITGVPYRGWEDKKETKGIDINPSIPQYLLKSYGGGTPDVLFRIASMPYMLTHEGIRGRNIPFVGRVVQEFDRERMTTQYFWDIENANTRWAAEDKNIRRGDDEEAKEYNKNSKYKELNNRWNSKEFRVIKSKVKGNVTLEDEELEKLIEFRGEWYD